MQEDFNVRIVFDGKQLKVGVISKLGPVKIDRRFGGKVREWKGIVKPMTRLKFVRRLEQALTVQIPVDNDGRQAANKKLLDAKWLQEASSGYLPEPNKVLANRRDREPDMLPPARKRRRRRSVRNGPGPNP